MSRLSQWLRRRGILARKPVLVLESGVGRHRLSPPIKVVTNVSAEMQQRLFDHLANVWDLLGQSDAHWSVVTRPEFRADKIAKTADRFYESGGAGLALIGAFFSRNGLRLEDVRTCLELGCGVGRMTSHFARHFDRVIAVDVSQRHLEHARRRLADLGTSNVDFVHIRRIEDFESLPAFDLLFSEIVLQHNPPPVALAILRLTRKLLPGGLCLFQTTTYIANYGFEPETYLANAGRSLQRAATGEHMEMHPLPQREIFRTLADAGIELLEMNEDAATADPNCLSHTFFGRKRQLQVTPLA